MERYSIHDIINQKIAIQTDTREKFDFVMELIIGLGGRDIREMDYKWDTYRKDTCLLIDTPYNSYSDLNYFIKNDYVIIQPEQLIEYNKELTYSLF